MDVRPSQSGMNPKLPSSNIKSTAAASAASVVFNLGKKKVQVKHSRIKQITRGLAEIAFSLGETNDPEEYAEELAEDIYEAMQDAKGKIQSQKKPKK